MNMPLKNLSATGLIRVDGAISGHINGTVTGNMSAIIRGDVSAFIDSGNLQVLDEDKDADIPVEDKDAKIPIEDTVASPGGPEEDNNSDDKTGKEDEQ